MKKNATPKTESSANITSVDYTTINQNQLYEMLRAGSLVTVDHPGDLVVVSRFLSLCEASADNSELVEAAGSVLDLIAHGRVTVEVI